MTEYENNELATEELEPIVETKDLNQERAVGRVKLFVDPQGKEHYVREGRSQRFIKTMGVDASWIVK